MAVEEMKLITIDEAAQRIGVHPNTIRNWLKAGNLKGYRIGPRFIRIDETELMEAVQRL